MLGADGRDVDDQEGGARYEEGAADVGETGDGGVRLFGVVVRGGDAPVAEAE